MDARTLRLLELEKIAARLENSCACALGRARVRALRPTTDDTEARRRLAETSEARRVLDDGKNPPFGGITDISQSVKNAAVGAMLDAASLLSVAQFAGGARRLRESIASTRREDFPILHAAATNIAPRPDLEKAIFDAIDESTRDIKDDASLDLLRARRAMRQTQHSIQTRLRSMLTDPSVQPHLQDAFVTVRDGRYCLPVRADSRGRVPGIVHDRSGSGGAFFVEPQAVVEMNNRLRELAADEQEAIRQILSSLSARVGGASDDLNFALEAAATLDFAFAKAHLSRDMNALEPLILPRDHAPEYALLAARHPLVEGCVANDILLGEVGDAPGAGRAETDEARAGGFDAMLITGPNTGGKTVVLKTLGLLTAMACCGLHLPVGNGSRLRLPSQIFADIGDEQSIEQSLSTFSSHVKNIIAILEKARAGDLILLDEVGAGTDPDEGAALAKAVLRTLQRRGAQIVATTHYGELKQFALGAQRFQNASVEFDVKTLRPTYHLRIGVPGASNALDIAARLGMPNDLVNRARRYLGRDRAAAEQATQQLEETQREMTQRSAEAERARDEIETMRREYSQQLEKLRAENQAERDHARRQAGRVLQKAQDESEAILRDLRRAARESKGTEEAREKLRELKRDLGGASTREAAATPVGAAAKSGNASSENSGEKSSGAPRFKEKSASGGRLAAKTASPFTAKIGDAVQIKSLGREGVLLSLPDHRGRAEVRVGAARVQVTQGDLETPRASSPGGVASILVRKAVNTADEINLIGHNVEDALRELDEYLDDAILAETKQVRIVHGKGSGALRNAIHRYLKNHSGVREYSQAPQNEGGEGATVAVLDA